MPSGRAAATHRITFSGVPLARRDARSASAAAASSASLASSSSLAARLVSPESLGARGASSSLSASAAPGMALRTIRPWNAVPSRSPVFASQDTTQVLAPAA